MGTSWGISGDVCHISVVLFCRYANHVCISYTARTNYGDECDFVIDYTYAIEICCMASHIHIASRSEP
jgi:hypothetical protein